MIPGILFFLLFPAVALWLCHRFPVLNKAGAIVICYAAGLLVGNLGLLPAGFRGAQEAMLNYAVPIALPLLFFSLDIRRWSRLAGISLLSFLFMSVAVLVAATVSFFIFRGVIGPESWKALGMLIGCYTGGTINLAAIGTALRTESNLFVSVNVADMLVTPLYLLFAITVLQRLLLLVLPPFARGASEAAAGEDADFTNYAGILSGRRIVGLAKALALALAIFAIGGGASLLVPAFSPVVAILVISTLGIACSFIPAVRKIEKSFQLGQYFILVFSLALSTMADVRQLLTTAPAAMAMVGTMVAIAAVIHVFLAAVAKIDVDTTITTSIACIFSPPFVPMVAAALKNREMVMTGVVTGILGWVSGTYLGIGYAYVLRLFG